ncbi:hypothetical protein QBC34DRAFT_49435 [Podospora aff. communis PSN243]|uniref:Secreted protein n=1 Tax=Podospora aff. communis PSN243 TaxID=3040156 RepID=A0AAV9GTM1_9PEZI|nr:hypothetical protein QBC34DRAFT_49435 [Podospora aff. communis PSN243]
MCWSLAASLACQLVIPGQASPAGRNRAREAKRRRLGARLLARAVSFKRLTETQTKRTVDHLCAMCRMRHIRRRDECPMSQHRQFVWMPPRFLGVERAVGSGPVGQSSQPPDTMEGVWHRHRSLLSPDATNRSPLQMPCGDPPHLLPHLLQPTCWEI